MSQRAKVFAKALKCHPAVLVFPGWDAAETAHNRFEVTGRNAQAVPPYTGNVADHPFGHPPYESYTVVGHTHPQKDENMKRKSHEPDDDLRPEYDVDFPKGERGRYYKRLLKEGSNAVVLDPDILEAFPDSASVNTVLPSLLACTGVSRPNIAVETDAKNRCAARIKRQARLKSGFLRTPS